MKALPGYRRGRRARRREKQTKRSTSSGEKGFEARSTRGFPLLNDTILDTLLIFIIDTTRHFVFLCFHFIPYFLFSSWFFSFVLLSFDVSRLPACAYCASRVQHVGMTLHYLIPVLHLRCIVSVVVPDHRVYKESARTLGVLDVDRSKQWSNVKKTHHSYEATFTTSVSLHYLIGFRQLPCLIYLHSDGFLTAFICLHLPAFAMWCLCLKTNKRRACMQPPNTNNCSTSRISTYIGFAGCRRVERLLQREQHNVMEI